MFFILSSGESFQSDYEKSTANHNDKQTQQKKSKAISIIEKNKANRRIDPVLWNRLIE